MFHDFNYEATLASSLRAQWQLDDVLRADQDLDFSRNFMPESLARTAAIESLNPFEQRILNHISAHQYLSIFGIVEEFILPFVLDHARTELHEDDWRVRALLNFAGEEAKHIHLFKRFHTAFVRGFPVECGLIGPSEEIGAEILSHDRLAVALVILMIEWMTQQHYVGSIRDDGDLDPLFKSLMKHHWMEEAQHAKLDTLIVEALAEGRSEEQIDKAIDEFFEIGGFLDNALKQQATFNL
ncbi:MAG: diiron oxygenase, partial [Sphingomicrobium sp.]